MEEDDFKDNVSVLVGFVLCSAYSDFFSLNQIYMASKIFQL